MTDEVKYGYIATIKENFGFIENETHDQEIYFNFWFISIFDYFIFLIIIILAFVIIITINYITVASYMFKLVLCNPISNI